MKKIILLVISLSLMACNQSSTGATEENTSATPVEKKELTVEEKIRDIMKRLTFCENKEGISFGSLIKEDYERFKFKYPTLREYLNDLTADVKNANPSEEHWLFKKMDMENVENNDRDYMACFGEAMQEMRQISEQHGVEEVEEIVFDKAYQNSFKEEYFLLWYLVLR